MEFLVRLEDKVNTQVFCLNPVHKGNHMDRVIFNDPTFMAPCPDCGSDEFLYRKNNAVTKKGHFITYKPDGWYWGRNERKHYGIVKIDCTEEEAKAWCEGIKDEQALADVEKYMAENDKEKMITAQNTAQIAYRPRKNKFDYEKVLSAEQIKDWDDYTHASPVISISEQSKSAIKEAI